MGNLKEAGFKTNITESLFADKQLTLTNNEFYFIIKKLKEIRDVANTPCIVTFTYTVC